jgi:hypothetical protein
MNVPDLAWWNGLSQQWKQAFAETCFHHSHAPTPTELAQLASAPALRFAGPRAPFPNMSFELTDLSGVKALTELEILVVIFHQLETITEVKHLPKLKSLFLYNNRLSNLQGIEDLTDLEQLYVQGNQLESIEPVEKLVNLKEFYINDNNIASLAGLTEEHADKLELFFCKPNANLKQKEILRVERDLGIRCRGL